MSAIRSMQDACEEIFLKNTTYWEADPINNGTFGPPVEFARTFCPSLCSRHGTCVNGSCSCNSNYTSADCSIDVNKGPSLRSIAVGGLCDVRKNKDCLTVRVVGYDFMETSKLSCRAIKIEASEFNKWYFWNIFICTIYFHFYKNIVYKKIKDKNLWNLRII